jgi:hypothetical protein
MKTNICRTLVFAALVIASCGIHFRAAGADTGKQIYELRVYTTQSEPQRKLVNEYWQRAGVPAYNRMGIQPIGVFTELQESATNKIYVLIPCDSAEVFASIPAKLAADAAYQKAAAEYLNLARSNSAYERIESSLLLAFEGMRKLAVPSTNGERGDWVFELRTYLSPSEDRGLNKIKMFNAGEIAVMKEVGLSPVFYGQMLVGSQMPCLVYLTAGQNMEEHQKHWKGFSAAPVWNQLKNDPEYRDNMFGMTKVMLKRTPASQL